MASDYSLYADLGNTNVHVGLYQRKWRTENRFEVARLAEDADWDAVLNWMIAGSMWQGEKCRSASVCASGEQVEQAMAAVERVTGVVPHLAGPELNRRVRVKYDPPESLGRDRVLAAIAARKSHGAPVIVLDVGTFITCDLVDEDGKMIPLGIAPGLVAVLEGALTVGPRLEDALLAAVRSFPSEAGVPAGNTVESLQNGLLAFLEGTIDRLVGMAEVCTLCPGPTPVVVTGGDAFPVREMTSRDMVHDEYLVLEGLRLTDPARKR